MIEGLLLLLALPVLIVTGYLFLLTLLSAPLAAPPAGDRSRRFVIVVPAHNEAVSIGPTVHALLGLDYPAASRRLLVVADNCSDRTAQLALEAGAQVLERHDPERRGKGYALEYAFGSVLRDAWADAVVVIDADTRAAPNLLSAFDAHIARGARALQAYYGVLNPLASWRTRLVTIALAIFHRLRSRGRERLGVSCGLRGNGMCFTTALLRQVPHRAFSIVEDLEYGVQLGMAGVRVEYADETEVLGEMVSGGAAATSQRRRWEGGRLQIARQYGLPLLGAALARRSRLLLDLALDVLVPPLGQVGLACVLLLIAVGACVARGWASPALLWLPLLATGFVTLHVFRGVVLSRLGWAGWSALLAAPVYVAWKLWVRLAGAGGTGWVRTRRENEPPSDPDA